MQAEEEQTGGFGVYGVLFNFQVQLFFISSLYVKFGGGKNNNLIEVSKGMV